MNLVGLREYQLILAIATLLLFMMLSAQSWDHAAYAQASPLVSTRGHFDTNTGKLKPGHNQTDYNPPVDIPGLTAGTQCSPEVAIYVHGIWVGENSLEKPEEIFDRARESLEDLYSITLVGFSWDSDTPVTANGSGWRTAKVIAENNGPKLAAFISELKDKCQQTDIRIIAHSMGARVVLSSLDELSKNRKWIESVHFMGATVDDEQISMNPLDVDDRQNKVYGNAINATVEKFYNLFNTEDDMLEYRNSFSDCMFPPDECGELMYYFTYEQDYALGERGAAAISELNKPTNYEDIDVRDQIPLIYDANMDGQFFGCDLPAFFGCLISETGDNHFGYVGFRDRPYEDSVDDTLTSNGAMDVIVRNWRGLP